MKNVPLVLFFTLTLALFFSSKITKSMDTEEVIYIWHSNTFTQHHEYIDYEFCIDVAISYKVEDLQVETNFGKIVFPGEIDSSMSKRYRTANLKVEIEEQINFFQVLKASGKVSGKVMDLTSIIQSDDYNTSPHGNDVISGHIPTVVGPNDELSFDFNKKPIKPYEISRFIYAESLILTGQDLKDTPPLTLGDLIVASIDIWKDNGKNLLVYNDNTNFINPIVDREFMTLVTNGKDQGFTIIQPEGEEISKNKQLFSFICNLQLDAASEIVCPSFEVTINGSRQDARDIIYNHPIFLRAIKDNGSLQYN
ncbi:MAG: hypothetical protein LBE38_03770 [Deltaproteobacteria bacterium]|jgi:hypothetical protein|nr:hypothetical protein [Deltaproteobacteria bacterium]